MLEFQTDVERKTDTEPTRETWTRGVAGAGPKAKVETETNTQTGMPNMQTSRQAGERSSGRVIERSTRAINKFVGNEDCSHSCSFIQLAPTHAFNDCVQLVVPDWLSCSEPRESKQWPVGQL